MNNQKRLTKIKRKLVCLALAIGLLLSAFSGLTFGKKNIYAYDEDLSSSYINDYNFTSYSGSRPYVPSNWKRIESEGTFNSETMVGGIFNDYNASDDYRKSYKVLEKASPGLPLTEQETTGLSNTSSYYYSLSLSAPYKTGGNFGYTQSSSSLNLSKNSFYEISVIVKTVSGTFDTEEITNYGYTPSTDPAVFDSRASIYLTGFSEDQDDASFEMISSTSGQQRNNGWGEFCFYIATNEFTAESSLNIELWLGSKASPTTGTVYFNQVKVHELDSNTFNTITNDADTATHKKLIDLRDTTSVTYPVTYPGFEGNWISDWDVVSQNTSVAIINNIDVTTFVNSDNYKKANLNSSDLSGTNLRSLNNNVLFMANTESAYTAIETKNDIVISRQTYYKLSLWAWSGSGESTAPTLKLVNTSDDYEIEDASISVSTSCEANSGATNGWENYVFYIYGGAYTNATCKLQICIGSDEESTTGYLYVDDIEMKQISYSQYNDGSSESNSATFSYNTNNSDYSVSNYNFNITENEANNNAYPLKPSSWTYSSTENAQNTTIYGVVNTNEDLFNASDLKIGGASGGVYNPGKLPFMSENTYNNVLMLGGKYSSTQTCTSSTFSLSQSDSTNYYSISFYVNAKNGGAGVNISNIHGTLLNLSNIKTEGWTKFTTLVKLQSTESDFSIAFSLNSNPDISQYAFFDYVIVESIDESIYEEANENAFLPSVFGSEFVVKVDRSKYDFELFTTSEYKSNGFTASENLDEAKAYVKVMDASELGQTAHSGNKVLVVYSNSASNGKYSAVTNRAFSVNSSSYYKITLYAKTININGNGAFIELSGDNFDEKFKELTHSDWQEYTFYVNSKTSSELSLTFGLSTESSGLILIDDISFEKLDYEDDEAFNAEVNDLKSANVNISTLEAAEEESEGEEDGEEDEPFEGSFNWYIVTSLITALAIIIAVVGTLLKKVDWKHGKRVKNSYDRRKTLDKDLDRRERIAKRQLQINELQAQLQEIEEEIERIKKESAEAEEARRIENEKIKAEIIARKEAIKAEKEQALLERNSKLAKDKNAFTVEEEEHFNSYIKQLEKNEKKEQLELAKHEKKVASFSDKSHARLEKYIARQEFIKAEIARIDAEIEEIAREEAQIWEEYRQAKADAKKRKAEYKASIKQQKEDAKAKARANSKKKSDEKADTKTDDDNSEK